MRITVKILGPRYFDIPKYDIVTTQVEIQEGARVMDLVEVLDCLYGLKAKILEGRDLRPMHDIWINGRSIKFLRGLETPLRDGDTVQVIPPFGG